MEQAHYVKRFGSVAVSNRFITMEHFINAMQIQVKENMAKGEHRFIGEILVDMGVMDESQVNKTLKAMKEMKRS